MCRDGKSESGFFRDMFDTLRMFTRMFRKGDSESSSANCVAPIIRPCRNSAEFQFSPMPPATPTSAELALEQAGLEFLHSRNPACQAVEEAGRVD
jgi:hypothetical protein